MNADPGDEHPDVCRGRSDGAGKDRWLSTPPSIPPSPARPGGRSGRRRASTPEDDPPLERPRCRLVSPGQTRGHGRRPEPKVSVWGYEATPGGDRQRRSRRTRRPCRHWSSAWHRSTNRAPSRARTQSSHWPASKPAVTRRATWPATGPTPSPNQRTSSFPPAPSATGWSSTTRATSSVARGATTG